MRRMHRIVLLVGLAALAPALVGCENFDLDKLDVFGLNDKKKLPGDRKAVFPEGVPGVSQGVPPEFIKGYQQPSDTAQAVPAESAKKTAAVEPGEEPKAKPKRKAKPRAAAQPAAQSQSDGQAQPPAWPSQGQQQAPQQAQTPWPGSAPAPGTFSR